MEFFISFRVYKSETSKTFSCHMNVSPTTSHDLGAARDAVVTHTRARLYDPLLMRFTPIDPLAEKDKSIRQTTQYILLIDKSNRESRT